MFWQAVNNPCAVPDQREYVAIVGRVAPIGDVQYAVRLWQEPRRRKSVSIGS